ncbi:iron-sulfur cluster repair di-iron protein ScdA [Macrococcus caseolyticus]|uniref:iron-sulfur cluster repair di-iron protein ScdA n=1 Tax=Macrococcoides caseolyticum TaxID=69966 RepID=UPI0024BCFCC6|nr:iron-sulfur cluster repair di-iron protein ScdA [Macrococcus caseolyticus]MDJ1089780.1 iron-sulfur cluster repair di-iron protein ScdA [Macrococcus caseolyticus]MDJ1091905.1 iron-sulfur cluster repair di-iron protein ScdA [Macrococcus caseolyticus]
MITANMKVSDIVKQLPKAADIFRKNRIDFCCGGDISLSEAIHEKSAPIETLLEEINQLDNESSDGLGLDVQYLDNRSLINYIQNKYHKPLEEEFRNLMPYITKVAKVHGERHPHLIEMKTLVMKLRDELIEHTKDEDDTVFPLIIEYSDNPTEKLRAQLKPHIDELESEHDGAGGMLKRLREITNDFTPPLDACGTYRVVYQRLAMLERETFQHVHLENNVLFERL